jgi:hypothetical protein
VSGDLANDKLSGPGQELERSLNLLTAQAELAVQESNPVQYFIRAMASRNTVSKNDPFEW